MVGKRALVSIGLAWLSSLPALATATEGPGILAASGSAAQPASICSCWCNCANIPGDDCNGRGDCCFGVGPEYLPTGGCVCTSCWFFMKIAPKRAGATEQTGCLPADQRVVDTHIAALREGRSNKIARAGS